MPAVLESKPIAASEEEQRALVALEQMLHAEPCPDEIHLAKLVDSRGGEIELPGSVATLLSQIVHHLAQGKAVSIVPLNRELTTQEAADLLNVSRPYLIKLLEQGEIPFVKTGTHRRIRFDDLMAYKQQRDATRRRGLARLTQMSQEMGLYDE